jgi:hypothetical protein
MSLENGKFRKIRKQHHKEISDEYTEVVLAIRTARNTLWYYPNSQNPRNSMALNKLEKRSLRLQEV